MSDRDFKGVWIPSDIWLNEDLALLDKVMLIEIDSLDGVDGCWKSNESFAEFFGVGTATIKRSVKKLTELSLIKRTMSKHDTGSRRVIKMIRPLSSLIRPLGSNRSDPSDQNDPQGNTVEGIVSKDTKGSDQIDVPNYIALDLWEDFLKMRKKKKVENTPRALKSILKKLEEFELKFAGDAERSIDNSIMNGWKGVFDIQKFKNHRDSLSNSPVGNIKPGDKF